jgi:predicted O-methyltransferase YrrM
MKIKPVYPKYLPSFLRPGWKLSKKINALISSLLNEKQIQQLDNLEGQLHFREGATLFYFAYTSSKISGRIVEIGSYKGKSTCWMGKALQFANSNEKIIAIDPHINTHDPRVPVYKEESSFEDFKNNLKNCGVLGYVEPIKKTSIDAAKNWNQPIKLLFIDGSHLYDDVMLDLKIWEPRVNIGGVIVMHDTKSTGPNVGAHLAMVDYVRKSGRFKNLLLLRNMSCFKKIK